MSSIQTNSRSSVVKRSNPKLLQPLYFDKPQSSTTLSYIAYQKHLKEGKKLSETITLPKIAVHKERSRSSGLQKFQVHGSKKGPSEGITDVDKNYFKIIQKRSQYKTKKLCKYQYITDINNCLRDNVMTGYYYDEVFKIDEQFATEKHIIEKIKGNMSQMTGCFETFLDDDHNESMNLVAKANHESAETAKRRENLKIKQERLGRTRNDIYALEEAYEKNMNCTSFLLRLTPDTYKQEVLSALEMKVPETTASMNSLEEIENQIEYEKNCRPKLYFSNPWQVLELLRDIEIQNVKFMLHTLEFKTKIQEQMNTISLLKAYSVKELNMMHWKVARVQNAIAYEEERNRNLEQRCRKLLEVNFKETTSGAESILITAYVEETYKYLFNELYAKESVIHLFDAIEKEYKKLQYLAGSIPKKIFNRTFGRVHAVNNKKIVKARAARRTLINLDILTQRTLKLLDKPIRIPRRKLMPRSMVEIKEKVKRKIPKERTESEILRDYLFTDLCRPQMDKLIFELDQAEQPYC